MMKVGIIGAGLGGLSAAILLAHSGFEVHIYEKNTYPGGKMRRYSLGSSQFDFGPNTITMPSVFQEVIAQTGAVPDDYFQFTRLEVHTRNHFADGSFFDLSSDQTFNKEQLSNFDPFAYKKFEGYIKEITRLYTLSEQHFFRKTFMKKQDFLSLNLLKALVKVRPLQTLHQFNQQYFEDTRLLQMVNRYATYVGSSPYETPATFAMIAYLEMIQGVYYVNGGNPTIADGFAKRATELGVQIHYGVEVTKISVESRKARQIYLSNGEAKKFDTVIINGDLLKVYPDLVESRDRPSFQTKHVESYQPTMSAFVLLASLNKRVEGLKHHQVFFSSDYYKEFQELFQKKQFPSDPTIYICNSSYTEKAMSPNGDNLMILINAPATTIESTDQLVEQKQKIYHTLSLKGFPVQKHVVEDMIISPRNISHQFHSFNGALYGPSANRVKDAFFRPSNKAKDINNLYFVGGSTHPGGGSPMVTMSGMNVANHIIQSK